MFLLPTTSFPPAGTSLVVIDSISTLFENAYQRSTADRNKKSEAVKWAAGRKYAMMGEVMSKLGRMAAVNHIAILLTCQTVTRIRSGLGALLLPAISGSEWDNGVSTQLVLFRDWPPRRNTQDAETDQWAGLRYAGAIKVRGVLAADDGRFETVVPFGIGKNGFIELSSARVNTAVPILSSPTRPPKRTYDEIADSEEEEPPSEDDYGWGQDDELAAGLLNSETLLTHQSSTQFDAPAPVPDS